jgi:hypothetical protein
MSLMAAMSMTAVSLGCGGAVVTESSGSTVAVQGDTRAVSQGMPAQLIIGGNVANFGRHQLTMGFMPDPATVAVTSGGGFDAATAGTGNPACGGWVTGQPDVIVDFAEMQGFLRFGFRPTNDGEDATLIINDGHGNWHCNDDGNGTGLNPMVDIADAPPGQYDIWIGSYQQGEYIQGELMITEIDSVTP